MANLASIAFTYLVVLNVKLLRFDIHIVNFIHLNARFLCNTRQTLLCGWNSLLSQRYFNVWGERIIQLLLEQLLRSLLLKRLHLLL